MRKKYLFILSLLPILLFNCDIGKNNSDIIRSVYGSTDSHNAGEDCIECHDKNGDTNIEFSIAGTIYRTNTDQAYPNVLLNLYNSVDIEDIPIETIEVDGKGNFYSNIPIDWQIGYYASITSDYQMRMMNGIVYNGSCNFCHGVNVALINIE